MRDDAAWESYLGGFAEEPGYLDWARFGPLAPAVVAEAAADAELLASGRPAAIGLVAARVEEARTLVADILGADASDVSLPRSLPEALGGVLAAQPGRVLLCAPGSSVLAAATAGIDDVARAGVGDLAEALSAEIRSVAVSAVDARTGALTDLEAVRALIGDRLLMVDGVHGFVAADAAWPAADVVAGSGHTWLRAGAGTGFLWQSPRVPRPLSPAGPDGSGEGDTDDDDPVDLLAAGRLAAALRDVVDTGVSTVATEIRERARHVMALADRYGIDVVTPRESFAGIATLAPAAGEAGALAAAFANRGVVATVRGDLVRVSVHAGTVADTLQLFGDALAEVAGHRLPRAVDGIVVDAIES